MVVTGAAGFRWLSGEERVRVFRRPSGFAAHFCEVCGSPAPIRHPGGKVVMVPVGLLAEDAGMAVGRHIFVGSKAAWDVLGDDAERFEGPGPE